MSTHGSERDIVAELVRATHGPNVKFQDLSSQEQAKILRLRRKMILAEKAKTVKEQKSPRNVRPLTKNKKVMERKVESVGDFLFPVPDDWRINVPAPPPGNLPLQERPGFVKFVGRWLQKNGLTMDPAPKENGCLHVAGSRELKLEPYQLTVSWLLNPNTPIPRLLVSHPTGSGKTAEMWTVLNAFLRYVEEDDKFVFRDSPWHSNLKRAVIIVPNASLVENFLNAGLKDPGMLGTKLRQLCGKDKVLNSAARSFLTNKTPIAVLNYLVAGKRLPDHGKPPTTTGEPTGLQKNLWLGMERPAAAKSPRRRTKSPRVVKQTLSNFNFLDDALVLMDEFHNISNPIKFAYVGAENATKFLEILQRNFSALDQKSSVVAAFTASPVADDIVELSKMLDVLRGKSTSTSLRQLIESPKNATDIEMFWSRAGGYMSVYDVSNDSHKFPSLVDAREDAIFPKVVVVFGGEGQDWEEDDD